MRRSLAVGCLIAIAVLLVDVGYWGWLLSTTPEASDLPHWQEVLNELSAYGGLALFALVALVVLAHLGVQAVRGGSRARGAWQERRELNDLLRRL